MEHAIRSRGSKALMIVLVVVAAILAAGLTKDMWVKAVVVAAARQAAGVNVEIDHLSLSLLKQSVHIKGVRVYNPDGFPAQQVMVDIPEVAVTLDVPSLFKGLLHASYVRFDLKEAHIIRSRAGALNVNSLKFSQSKSVPPSQGTAVAGPAGSKPEAAQQMAMRLDEVRLNIGTVYYEDYTAGMEKPRLTVMKVNIKNAVFKDITSPEQLGTALMFQALAPAGLEQAFAAGSQLLEEKTGVKGLGNLIGGLFQGGGRSSDR